MNRRFQSLPLRQRKFADTKVSILEALVARLDERPLEAISTKELAAAIPISEASFFNYFPKKTDLIVYFIQLWSIGAMRHARSRETNGSALAAIEAVFEHTAKEAVAHPGTLREVIAAQARMGQKPALQEISLAERLRAFPDADDIDDIPAAGLDQIVTPLLAQAVETGELPKEADLQLLMLAVCSIFFGTPILLLGRAPEAIGAMYRAELELLWQGAGARA